MVLEVDLAGLPVGVGGIVATPGDVWHFQAWHRDMTPSGSNLTDAIAVRVE